MLQIRCKNNDTTKSFPEGTSLLDVYQAFADEIEMLFPVVSAKVNNVSQGLKFRLFQNRDVEFFHACSGSGRRVYVRSLCFVLYKAICDVFAGSKLFIEHPISNGYYCNFKKKNAEPLTEADVHATIIALVKEMKDRLQDGNTVVLDGFGRFHLTIQSEMVDKPEDYNLKYHVRRILCKFTPAANRNQFDRHLERPLIDGADLSRV